MAVAPVLASARGLTGRAIAAGSAGRLHCAYRRGPAAGVVPLLG